MRSSLIGFAVLIVGSTASSAALAQRAVILVRHAEKEADPQLLRDSGVDPEKLRDPAVDLRVPISRVGKERAAALARVLGRSRIDVIYTSRADRTRQTAQPTAEALGITPKPIERDQIPRFSELHRDQVVLIVGHSNTLPGLIDTLTKRSNGITIDDETFDDLFILLSKPDGTWGLLRSKY